MLEQDFRALNSRIDSLIQKVQALSAENQSLKQNSGDTRQLQAQLQALSAENQQLKQANVDTRQLQAQLDALKVENQQLKQASGDTQQLKEKEAAWQAERNKLLAEKEELSRKNDHARARVEAIILRLKALESPEA